MQSLPHVVTPDRNPRAALPAAKDVVAQLEAQYAAVCDADHERDAEGIPRSWDIDEASYDDSWGAAVRAARINAKHVLQQLKLRPPRSTIKTKLRALREGYALVLPGLQAIPVPTGGRVRTLEEYAQWLQRAAPADVVEWLGQQPAEHISGPSLMEYITATESTGLTYDPRRQETDAPELLPGSGDRVWAVRLKAIALMLMPVVTREVVLALMSAPTDGEQVTPLGVPEFAGGVSSLPVSRALSARIVAVTLMRRSLPVDKNTLLCGVSSSSAPVWDAKFWHDAEKECVRALLPINLRPTRGCLVSEGLAVDVVLTRLRDIESSAATMATAGRASPHDVKVTHRRLDAVLEPLLTAVPQLAERRTAPAVARWSAMLTFLGEHPVIADHASEYTYAVLLQAQGSGNTELHLHRRVAERYFRTRANNEFNLRLRHVLQLYEQYEEAPPCRESIVRKFLANVKLSSATQSHARRALLQSLARWLPAGHEHFAKAAAGWCVTAVSAAPPFTTVGSSSLSACPQHSWRRAGDPRRTVPDVHEALEKYAQRLQAPVSLSLAADLYIRSMEKESRRDLPSGASLWSVLWDTAPAFRLVLRAAPLEIYQSVPPAFWSRALQSTDRPEREFWIRRLGEVRALAPSTGASPAHPESGVPSR